MYNPKKDFSKEFTRCIVTPLKAFGFKKHKSNNIIRLTSENILQSINFQKSRWGGDLFYVNINVIPLQFLQQSFFGEGGIRIESLTQDLEKNGRSSFNFSHQVNARASFADIRLSMKEKIIPWLDMLSTPQGILEFESDAHESQRNSIFPYYSYGRLFSKAVKAFLSLAMEEYSMAEQLLLEVGRNQKDDTSGEMVFVRDKQYDFLISMIQNKDFDSIKTLIDSNIEDSIHNLKLESIAKFTAAEALSLDDLATIFSKKRVLQQIPGKDGVDYHHMILNVHPGDLTAIYEQLKKDFEYPISWFGSNRIVVEINDDYCFYLCLNEEEYVLADSEEIAAKYKGSKSQEIIASSKTRIDFWGGDDSYRVLYINYYMLLLDSVKKLNNYIYWVKNNIFYDEI
jgi:Domain of unknown function (DUF4304)